MWRCLIATKIVVTSFGLRCWSHGIFLASFLLHAKYKLSFPVETALVRQRVVFFSLSVERNARETGAKKKRLLACVQTPPSSPQEKSQKSSFPEGRRGSVHRLRDCFAVYAVIGKKTNKQKLVGGFQSEMLIYFPVFVIGKLGRISARVLKACA